MPADCRFPDEDRPFFARHAALSALLLIFGLGLFALSLYSLLTHSLLFPLDKSFETQFSAMAKTSLAGPLPALTWFGNIASIAPTLACLILAYVYLRQKCDDRFTLILTSYGLGVVIFFLLAEGVNRQRPALPGLLANLPFPSFPSGHMIQTTTLLTPLLYLYLARVRSAATRTVLIIAAFVYLAAIAVDRLVVNAHYLTDVLAGLGVGITWSVIVLLLFERSHLRANAAGRPQSDSRVTHNP